VIGYVAVRNTAVQEKGSTIIAWRPSMVAFDARRRSIQLVDINGRHVCWFS